MRIDIWSDVVCPWCFIGKRRLETALAGFEHAADVEVVWHSFQLDPGAPDVPVETVAEALGRKYGGGPDAGKDMIDRVEAVAAEEGMVWRHHDSLRVGTMDAHRLLHLAHHEGGSALQGALKEALLSAYFVEARNVADHAVLREVAVGAGVDATAVDRVLGSDELADEVWADIEQAQRFGATGVPFFVIDEKYGVSGAQPADTFTQVLERAWSERTPAVQMVAARRGSRATPAAPTGAPYRSRRPRAGPSAEAFSPRVAASAMRDARRARRRPLGHHDPGQHLLLRRMEKTSQCSRDRVGRERRGQVVGHHPVVDGVHQGPVAVRLRGLDGRPSRGLEPSLGLEAGDPRLVGSRPDARRTTRREPLLRAAVVDRLLGRVDPPPPQCLDDAVLVGHRAVGGPPRGDQPHADTPVVVLGQPGCPLFDGPRLDVLRVVLHTHARSLAPATRPVEAHAPDIGEAHLTRGATIPPCSPTT